MLCSKASHGAKAIAGTTGHYQNSHHYFLTDLTDMVAVKDTGWHLNQPPLMKAVSLTWDFYMLLKTLNRGLPVEVWSPTGQRLHYLIGLLPDTLQASLLLMSFKAERHLTCLPTLWDELVYTVQKERDKNSPGWSPCVTSASCHIISRKREWLQIIRIVLCTTFCTGWGYFNKAIV